MPEPRPDYGNLSQLQQGRSELAALEAECGAVLSDPGEPQDLLAQLRRCAAVAQKLLERAHEQLRHVTSLRDELLEVRSENDRLRAAVADLRRQAAEGVRREDELRAEATAQRDRAAAALAVRSDLERRLVEVEDRLRTATENSDRLESAAQAARDRLAEFERDIAQKPTLDDGDLEAARRRIEQLTVDLDRACNANARLCSLLNVFGMVDHLEG